MSKSENHIAILQNILQSYDSNSMILGEKNASAIETDSREAMHGAHTCVLALEGWDWRISSVRPAWHTQRPCLNEWREEEREGKEGKQANRELRNKPSFLRSIFSLPFFP